MDSALDHPGFLANAWRARALLSLRIALLVLGIGLIPLAIGASVLAKHSRANARQALEATLTTQAQENAASLTEYFSRARDVILLTAQNPAFTEFYGLPGGRSAKTRARIEPVLKAENALAYIERLYPKSIGEACFIDRSGAEIARVVRGHRAPFAELSLTESKNPFFGPSFALSPGEVYQARPYVSPDTKEWVVSNSTPLGFADGRKRAIVHFEVTIESFRRTAGAGGRYEIAFVDAGTGRVLVNSRVPQRVGAILGVPADRRFATLAGTTESSGILDIENGRAAYLRVQAGRGNANDWFVVAVSKSHSGPALRDHLTTLAMVLGGLLLIAFGMGRRWARLNREFAVQRAQSQRQLRESEVRYRHLFHDAEQARVQLAEQNEQLLVVDRLKDEFVALVSHELRTPLTSIHGYVELLTQTEELTEEQQGFIEVISRNSDRLGQLVGDLLFMAQVQAGRLNLVREPVDLVEIVRSSIEAANPIAAQGGIALAADLETVPTVSGDRLRLAQLLDNLISNAIKFTPGGGRVTVRVATAGGAAVMEIADTGMGIPASDQKRLFEPFFRSAEAAKRSIPGTGLGLSIAQAIAEAHEGSISFVSSEGGGTTFRIELPALSPAEAARAA